MHSLWERSAIAGGEEELYASLMFAYIKSSVLSSLVWQRGEEGGGGRGGERRVVKVPRDKN